MNKSRKVVIFYVFLGALAIFLFISARWAIHLSPHVETINYKENIEDTNDPIMKRMKYKPQPDLYYYKDVTIVKRTQAAGFPFIDVKCDTTIQLFSGPVHNEYK